MSHGITSKDSLFTVRKPAWHGLGRVLRTRPEGVDDALQKSGQNWKVDKVPLFRKNGRGYIELPDIYGIRRLDTGDILGAVGERYEPVQNVEGFRFLDNLLGTAMMFETAGSLHGGKKVWVLAKIPDYIVVGGDGVAQYVLFTNRHDGLGAVQVLVTPVRVVCQNTLTCALSGTPSTYKVRHVGDVSSKVAEARQVLDLTVDYYKQFAKTGNKLASQKMTERKMRNVVAELYPGETGMGDRALKNRQHAREAVMHLFVDGRTVGNAPGSKWCAVNAIAEHADWGARAKNDERRFERTIADPDGIKARGLELVTAA